MPFATQPSRKASSFATSYAKASALKKAMENGTAARHGLGGTPLEADDGFAGMDLRKAIDAQRGERESAAAPA